jgi:flavin-binding protein dodecin
MSDYITKGAVKVIEIVGISDRGFEDAVKQGLHKASETIDGITGAEVLKQTARVDNKMITQYHVNMKVAFAVKSAKE